MLRVPLADLAAGERLLPAEASRYLVSVHRLSAGDRFVAFDPEACREAEGEVCSVSRRGVRVRFGPPVAATHIATRRITVIQAMAKGTKLDDIVRDATELGATKIAVAIAARSVKRSARVGRLRRIAVEAARQCGRGDAPEVTEPSPLADALERHRGGGRWTGMVLDPDASIALGQLLVELGDEPIVVVIGPEGGLRPDEIELAERLGYRAVKLGGFVMRAETACAAVLGAIAALGPSSAQ